jgi:hypothetical protein
LRTNAISPVRNPNVTSTEKARNASYLFAGHSSQSLLKDNRGDETMAESPKFGKVFGLPLFDVVQPLDPFPSRHKNNPFGKNYIILMFQTLLKTTLR